MQDLENAIVEILEKQKSPVTFSFLEAVLKAAKFTNTDFATINKIVDGLVKKDIARIGIEGIELKKPVVANKEARGFDDKNTEDLTGETTDLEEHLDQNGHGILDNEQYLDYDILIGASEETPSEDYEHISPEELDELLTSLSLNRPSVYSFSDEKTIGVSDDSNPVKGGVSRSITSEVQFESLPPLRINDSLSSSPLSNRVKNALSRCNIETLGELIRQFDFFIEQKGLGLKTKKELIRFIEASAQECSLLSTVNQLKALQALSNNVDYYFDPFGTLMHANNNDFANDNEDDPGEDALREPLELSTLPLDVLNMGEAITKCFRRNGITTVGGLASATDEQLLSLRGIGQGKIEKARVALNSLSEQDVLGNISGLQQNDAVDPGAYNAFLEQFDNEAIRVLDECAIGLKDGGLDVYTEALIPTFLPLAQQAIEVSEGDFDAARELVFEVIAESPLAISAFKTSLEALLSHAKAREAHERVICSFSISENSIWKNHAMDVIRGIEGCRFDEITGKVSFAHPSLDDWVGSLPDRDAELITLRLNGFTLEECGQKVGDITRERARQITEKLFENRPLLEEDSYLSLYMEYDIDRNQFPLITGQDVKVFNYFERTSRRKDRKHLPLSKALSDDSVPEDIKKKIRELLNKDFVFIDGERVHIDRRSIILHISNRLTAHSKVTLNELYDAYCKFLDEHSLSNKKLAFGRLHNFQEWTKRNAPEVLSIRNDAPIRYYDANQFDFRRLEEFVTSGIFDDMEISAALILNHPEASEIIQELDINDEYELHYLLKNHCNLPSEISFGRMPTITFGEGDRDRQIKELIQEEGPIGLNELAERYNQKYGVAVDTFKGSYLHGFEIFKSHGVYSCSYEDMDEEQLATLSSLLTKDYRPISLIKLQFKDRYPGSSTSLINEKNLAKAGYRASHDLLIKADLNETEVFERLIDTNRTFGPDTDGFCIEVFKHEDFKRILQTRINALDIVEYEKDKYVHLDMLLEALEGKASRDDFEEYVESVLELAEKETPFTVYSLRKMGFSHPVEDYVDEVGFDDKFLESLISTARVGGRIKSTTASEHAIFCKTPYVFSVIDLFEHALTVLKRIDIDELCAYLKDEYDVEFSATLARSIVKRSELVYNADLDMVFADKDEYDKMVQEVLAESVER